MMNGHVLKLAAVLFASCVLAGGAWAAEETKKAPPEKPAASGPDKSGLHRGYRGLTLPVFGHQLVFLNKGDRVDVLVTFEAKMQGDIKEKVTATILQNVLVVEVQKPSKLDEKGAVELLVNPNEAQYAALSDSQGGIFISKRAEGDTEMHPMEMASYRKLFR